MARPKARSLNEITSFMSEFQSQTDRGAAIVAAAVLDDTLGHLIETRLVPLSHNKLDDLFGRFGPFNSLSANVFRRGIRTPFSG